jgi:hypothetical protein
MLHRSRHRRECIMLFDPPRTAAIWVIYGIPATVLTLVIAALIQPAVWAIAGLAGIVGASAWTAKLWRRGADTPMPSRFIGS